MSENDGIPYIPPPPILEKIKTYEWKRKNWLSHNGFRRAVDYAHSIINGKDKTQQLYYNDYATDKNLYKRNPNLLYAFKT